MDNQAIIDKIADLSDKHAALLKQGKHAECNKIAAQIRELRPRADYGFRKQELVEFKIRNR